MSASDQPRFLFWLVTAFIMALTLYGVASLLLPRLIRFNQLPESGELYVDSADALSTRIAYSMCNLWLARDSYKTGFSSTSQYKSVSASVDKNTVASKLFDSDCKDFIFNKQWTYTGDEIDADKKIYNVEISLEPNTIMIPGSGESPSVILNNDNRKIIVNVKEK
ncbi:MAG: hypothetical protein HYT71_01390 [Candidatus Aenigmarchaeota archaeon]|nr:hypothetical protein [Candidatus Aenigmarchaeota archaeon]